MPDTFNKRIKIISIITIVIGVLLLVGVSVVSYKYVEKLSTNSTNLYQDYNYYQSFETVNASVFYLESNERGYLLTGNENYLTGDTALYKLIEVKLKEVEPFFITNDDKRKFDKYKIAVRNKLEFVKLAIDTRKKFGKRASDSLIITGRGPLLAKSILDHAKTIKQILQSDIDLDKKDADKLVDQYNIWDLSNFLSTFIIAVVVLFLLFRTLRKRNKLTNELKEQMKKAEDAVVIKEQFLANMSHEIRTPMNAIIGFTNLLSKTNLNEKQETYLKAIKSSSSNLLNITNDILDYSKLESGMFRIEKINFDIKSLIHSVYTMFSEKASTNEVGYTYKIDNEISTYVLGDPTRLTQILVNLLSNAFKFTSDGSVNLEAKLLVSYNNKVEIEFSISDSGIGIKKEDIDKIFERFNQAEANITRQYGGTGLGLSIVKRLVELQGGKIHVESEHGKGSRFIFNISYENVIDPKEILVNNNNDSTPLNVGHKKILLVEDNNLNQLLAQELLQSYGLDVTLAENGQVAIQILKDQGVDLILMDLQMPVMDGYKTAEYIRNTLKLSIPIIAMSAHVLVAERERCLRSGMNDFVSKPFKEEEFKNVLRKHLTIREQNKPLNIEIQSEIIDLSGIKKMSKGNDDFVKKMINLFLTDTPIDLHKLKQAIESKDYKQVEAVSHKLKSSVGIIGMRKEAKDILEKMETSAASSSGIESMESELKQFQDYYMQAEIFLNK